MHSSFVFTKLRCKCFSSNFHSERFCYEVKMPFIKTSTFRGTRRCFDQKINLITPRRQFLGLKGTQNFRTFVNMMKKKLFGMIL